MSTVSTYQDLESQILKTCRYTVYLNIFLFWPTENIALIVESCLHIKDKGWYSVQISFNRLKRGTDIMMTFFKVLVCI